MYGSLSLFFAGQLALLIWWVRSQSRTDFSGRFRIWAWGSAFCFVFALTVALDLHHVWSATLLWFCKIDFWQKETLCWLAPTVGSATALMWEIKSDMRGCRISLGLFWLALFSWSISAALTLGLGDIGQLGIDRVLAATGAAMLGHFSVFASMLFHARYVAYVSAESPPRPQRLRWATVLGSVVVFIWRTIVVRRRVAENENADPRSDRESESYQAAPCAPPEKIEAAVKKKRKRRSREKEAASSAHDVGNDENKDSAQPQSTGPAVEQAAAQTAVETDDDSEPAPLSHRLDNPIDSSQLKGLSKRERRKLRKEHREQQR